MLSEECGRCLAPSPSCWIFYHVWKAIQWNHQREGEDVAGVLSSLTSPHLRGHRGTDTLQHLSAGPRPFSKAWAAPPTSPRRAIVCLGPPIQSRVGDLSLIKPRCQGPRCPPTLPFQVGRNRTETDMSALFDLEVMQMVRKGCSEEGRKNVDVAFKFKSKMRVELTRLMLPSTCSVKNLWYWCFCWGKLKD